MEKKKYDSSSIEILTGLEGIKKRPEMYIGDISNGDGIHHLIFEVIDNSVDEYLNSNCNEIIIKLKSNNSILIKDNGRGIPIDIKLDDNNNIKRNSTEIVLSELHSGGKFNNKNYKFSGGLHGLGLSCLNALSEWLKIIIYKNNKIFFLKFENSLVKTNYFERYKNLIIKPMIILDKTNITGTEINFLLNKNIFKNINYNENIILKKLKEISFLNKNLKLIFINEKKNYIKTFLCNNGIIEFIKELNINKNHLNKNILYIKKIFQDSTIEVAMQWIFEIKENILCYTNNIFQKNGGSHLIGLNRSLLNFFIKNINKKNKIKIEDIKEGLICILSVKTVNPKFSSQIKDKLVSNEIKKFTEITVKELLENYFQKKKTELKLLINKIIKNYKLRNNKINIKNLNNNILIKNKNKFSNNKLSDCREKNPEKSEIYIVEGDSAGGSAKQCRDRKTQAILSLKGKILNVEKSSYEKLLKSESILSLIKSLGCGIKENFNIKNLKYKKIIIMTDADVDGLHIRTLLLTFFYKYMKDLLKLGYIYISNPPLYKISYNKKDYYMINIKKLSIFINKKLNIFIKNTNFYNKKNIKINFFYKYILLYKKIFKRFKKKYLMKIFFKNKLKFDNILNILIFSYKLKNIKFKNFIKLLILINIKNTENIFLNIKIIKFKNILNNIIISKKLLLDLKYNYFYKIYKKILKINKNKIFIKNKNKKIYFKNIHNILKYFKNIIKNKIKKQRYKGLGEMNPEQLWNTTMNPKKRCTKRVFIDNENKTEIIFNKLMGNATKERKKILENFFKKNINQQKIFQ